MYLEFYQVICQNSFKTVSISLLYYDFTFLFLFNELIHVTLIIDGYDNLFVTSTEPKINDTLFTPYPDKISITYSLSITPGSGNITIFEKDIIKQTFPGNSKHCEIVGDERTTISCNVLNSTFNHFDTSYKIVVGSNFVRNSFLNEPLVGKRWNLKTNGCMFQFLNNNIFFQLIN